MYHSTNSFKISKRFETEKEYRISVTEITRENIWADCKEMIFRNGAEILIIVLLIRASRAVEDRDAYGGDEIATKWWEALLKNHFLA